MSQLRDRVIPATGFLLLDQGLTLVADALFNQDWNKLRLIERNLIFKKMRADEFEVFFAEGKGLPVIWRQSDGNASHSLP